MKVIDLRKNVAELVSEYPELKGIMVELGFKDITSPVALKFMGKVMTIPKGAAIKGIPMDRILTALTENGFQVTGVPGQENEVVLPGTAEDRNTKLKNLILRLNQGEDLESVRADFVRDFESVSVHDIVKAEQGLIDDGLPMQEVQKLCDLHSALFHGKTEAELWAEEERNAGLKVAAHEDPSVSIVAEGHPVDVLRRENTALEKVLDHALEALQAEDVSSLSEALKKLRKIDILYSKKESILMPMLLHHGVTGPNDVMWGVDDEIKAEVARLSQTLTGENFAAEKASAKAVLNRMKEMIYKEENIFFPLCLEHLTEEEWLDAYRDLPEMGFVFIDSAPKWTHGEEALAARRKTMPANMTDGLLYFPGGKLNMAQLNGLFKVLPIDITFIDENDINRFFTNEGRVFSRPLSALDRSTYECHPERVKPMVKKLLDDFKSGARDYMEVWTPNDDHPVRVIYAAVRDEKGTYLGAAELVEDFTAVKERFDEKAGRK
ncbi:MAG: DUF438 domain-containing protein [Lachnospiraceae bacterium]|nr:DUF438 domain-containing protein [Lachnospiraceae bacterium]